jgi:Leucine-rich repeat (LRR) protein
VNNVTSPNPKATRMRLNPWLIIPFVVIEVCMIGCSVHTCNDAPPLESSQQTFLNEFMTNNGIARQDFIISTANTNGCPTSNILFLRVSDKKLKALPASVKNMKFLSELTMINCQLNSLPESLLEMPQIKWIMLDSNRICNTTPAMDSFLTYRNPDWKKTQICP